jgi:RNA polymerase sigma-70 factor (ECF subfamily)
MEIAQVESAEQKQADPRIHVALSKLRPDDRALLLLYYWEELSLQEIAETLGTNVNAAKTRLYRAREKFRGQYEGEEE